MIKATGKKKLTATTTKIIKSKHRDFSPVFFSLHILIFAPLFLNTGKTRSCYRPFPSSFWLTGLWRFAFSEIGILIVRCCFGSTNCHFNATYWSCRQPASHKSCKVPENMIYELSYGKWGPLIFLTLQDVVAYHSLLSGPKKAGLNASSQSAHSSLPRHPPITEFLSTHLLPWIMTISFQCITSPCMLESNA